MPSFLLAYTGGGDMSEATPEQRQASMDAWMAWFGGLGGAVVDPGNPVGASVTLSGGGSRDGGASALTGYTILSAESLQAAAGLAGGCPLLAHGGAVEVYEIVPVM